MSELIKAVINIKNPVTFLAFFTVVLLFAFRTKAVPELFFGLLKDKLTKERFSQLLNRSLLYGFGAFLVVCSIAVVGQVLAYKAQASPMSVQELKAELQNLKSSPNQNQEAIQQAISAYEQGVLHLDRREFDQAIQSIQASLNKIPTLSAQYTLAYLYQRTGDDENARKHANEASILAQTNGSALDVARVDRLKKNIEEQNNRTLVGVKSELPQGGDSFENAPPISQGFYIQNKFFGDQWSRHYFRLHLKTDQILTIRFRTPDSGAHSTPTIYDRDGGFLIGGDAWGGSVKSVVKWRALEDGTYYINFTGGGAAGTVYLLSIQ